MSSLNLRSLSLPGRLAVVAAVAAPLAGAVGAIVGVHHTSNASRQLDIIAAHPASFTAMLICEHILFALVAVLCVALAVTLTGRGQTLARVAAVAAVVGAAAEQADFGDMLVPLAHMHDRAAALYAVHHVGGVFTIAGIVSPLVTLGLLLAFVAACRARLIPLWAPVALIVGLAALMPVANNHLASVAVNLLLFVPMGRLALGLFRPRSPQAGSLQPTPAYA